MVFDGGKGMRLAAAMRAVVVVSANGDVERRREQRRVLQKSQ